MTPLEFEKALEQIPSEEARQVYREYYRGAPMWTSATLQMHLDASPEDFANHTAFMESGGPEMMRQASLKFIDDVPTAADLEDQWLQ